VASDVHPGGGVILLVEDLSFQEKFESQAEIEAASIGIAQ
jgi:hypothetical protein